MVGQQVASVLAPHTHFILGHHVSPVQDKSFDDLVATEPCGIMQSCVTFL